MENQKHGVNETKELLEFGFSLQKGLTNSLEDKRVDFYDLPNLLPALKDAAPAFGGIEKVPQEMADLSADEQKELITFARTHFDLPNDELEELIIETLDTVLAIVKVAVKWDQRIGNRA